MLRTKRQAIAVCRCQKPPPTTNTTSLLFCHIISRPPGTHYSLTGSPLKWLRPATHLLHQFFLGLERIGTATHSSSSHSNSKRYRASRWHNKRDEQERIQQAIIGPILVRIFATGSMTHHPHRQPTIDSTGTTSRHLQTLIKITLGIIR